MRLNGLLVLLVEFFSVSSISSNAFFFIDDSHFFKDVIKIV